MKSVWLQGFACVQYWEDPQHPYDETERRVLAALAVKAHIRCGCQAGIVLYIHTCIHALDVRSILMYGVTGIYESAVHNGIFPGCVWVIISIDACMS